NSRSRPRADTSGPVRFFATGKPRFILALVVESAVIGVLLSDTNREWRVTGYLGFQTHPQVDQIPALLHCFSAELKEIEAGRETRPFFQWLNSVYTCVTSPSLRAARLASLGAQSAQ